MIHSAVGFIVVILILILVMVLFFIFSYFFNKDNLHFVAHRVSIDSNLAAYHVLVNSNLAAYRILIDSNSATFHNLSSNNTTIYRAFLDFLRPSRVLTARANDPSPPEVPQSVRS
jgi:hypothetical protein